MSNPETWTQMIKEEASRLGFLFSGISKAQFLEEEASHLENWLKQDYHGEMSYMGNHFDKRLDPRKLVPGSKSVISLAYNYYPEEIPLDPESPKIARYAYGEDYHHVVKDQIYLLMEFIQENIGKVEGRIFIDSAPVMERTWAEKSGLGWIGKNTLLIHKKSGSYFFLGEIILDLELIPDSPMEDHCGTCTRCIDACPTGAILDSQILDARKCISYLTIELKNEIPHEFHDKMDNWVFGCDICQEVCPWNRFSLTHTNPLLKPKTEMLGMSPKDWKDITQDIFDRLFAKSPLTRTGFPRLKQNLEILEKNSKPWN